MGTEPYSPWAHVLQMADVLVAYDDLEHAESYWEPEERVILLDRGLNQSGRRSRLAHELAHIDRGDECCNVGPDGDRIEGRVERATDELAARRLIPLSCLADALVWSLDCDVLAEDLHVAESLVRARLGGLTTAEQRYLDRRITAQEQAA